MKVLLIGGLGYIGSTLTDLLLESRDYKVTAMDTLRFSVDPAYLHRIMTHHRFRFVKEDVSDMRFTWDLIRNHDVVVYLASLTMADTARNPEEGLFVNRYMAEVVGDCCAKLDKKMIFMSTCSNYGKSDKPVDENLGAASGLDVCPDQGRCGEVPCAQHIRHHHTAVRHRIRGGLRKDPLGRYT